MQMARVDSSTTQQRLVVHGRELNARKTMKDYSVALGENGDIVDLMLREFAAEPTRMRIYGSPTRSIN